MEANDDWRVRTRGKREALAIRRRRADERARVEHVTEPLAAMGVAVRLVHPGDPMWGTGRIGDRAAVEFDHVDWAATPVDLDIDVPDLDARAQALADALEHYGGDMVIATGGNAAQPALMLARADAIGHMATLAELDPFELRLMTPAASWLVEARGGKVRATNGMPIAAHGA